MRNFFGLNWFVFSFWFCVDDVRSTEKEQERERYRRDASIWIHGEDGNNNNEEGCHGSDDEPHDDIKIKT